MANYLNIVVTGDVDSGKSTLIGRFLYETDSLSQGVIEEIDNICKGSGSNFEFAYLLDSFEEERKGQLTIDTTQAFCRTKKGKEFIFIDVPGHRELLRNMLSGSSYADIALLVVDVQKLIGEQTYRHAIILQFLGIGEVIAVLNRMDLVGFDQSAFDRAKKIINDFFRKLDIKLRYFIPISAREGDNLTKKTKNMPWYKGPVLLDVLNSHTEKKGNDGFRLPIQDIYVLSNGQKIAVGKIISGRIKKGERVKILPLNREGRIKGIRVFQKNRTMANAPESIGLVLDEMDGLSRGQIICKPRLPRIEKEVLVKFFCSRPLNIREDLVFRCTTQEAAVRISKINRVWDTANLELKFKQTRLEENDLVEAIIVAERPVVTEKYLGFNSLGRFVLRHNNREICAVGIIL